MSFIFFIGKSYMYPMGLELTTSPSTPRTYKGGSASWASSLASHMCLILKKSWKYIVRDKGGGEGRIRKRRRRNLLCERSRTAMSNLHKVFFNFKNRILPTNVVVVLWNQTPSFCSFLYQSLCNANLVPEKRMLQNIELARACSGL